MKKNEVHDQNKYASKIKIHMKNSLLKIFDVIF